jgi:hypothetical protein
MILTSFRWPENVSGESNNEDEIKNSILFLRSLPESWLILFGWVVREGLLCGNDL